MFVCFQEYSEWKKEAADISLPGVYIGLMDRLNSFSRVIVDSTQELCALLVSSYIDKVKETCKSGEDNVQIVWQRLRYELFQSSPVPHESHELLTQTASVFIFMLNVFFFYIADKMGIKTTVHEIVAAKQNMSIPNPETRDDFLKCKRYSS